MKANDEKDEKKSELSKLLLKLEKKTGKFIPLDDYERKVKEKVTIENKKGGAVTSFPGFNPGAT